MKKPISRRLIPLAVVLVILAIIWAGGWFWLARWVDQAAAGGLQELSQRGVDVNCTDRSVGGFPFALRVTCAETAVADRSTDSKANLAGVSGGASIFSPMTARVAMTSPARLDAPGAGSAAMQWERASLGVGLGMNGPRDVSFDTTGLQADLSVPDLPIQKLVSRSAEGSLAPSAEGGTDLSVTFTDVGVSLAGASLPTVSGRAAAELSVPPRALPAGRAGMQAPVWARDIDVLLQSGGARLGVTGEIAVDAEGVIDGKMVLRVGGAEELPKFIAALPEEWQKLGNAVAGGLFAFGRAATLEGEPASELTVEITRGEAKIGPIEFSLPKVPL